MNINYENMHCQIIGIFNAKLDKTPNALLCKGGTGLSVLFNYCCLGVLCGQLTKPMNVLHSHSTKFLLAFGFPCSSCVRWNKRGTCRERINTTIWINFAIIYLQVWEYIHEALLTWTLCWLTLYLCEALHLWLSQVLKVTSFFCTWWEISLDDAFESGLSLLYTDIHDVSKFNWMPLACTVHSGHYFLLVFDHVTCHVLVWCKEIMKI